MAKQRAPKVKRINVSAIRVSATHWKRDISKEDIEQMADAMAEDGQLSMPIVRPSPRAANFYELLAGRKRYEAARLNHMPTMNCIVVEAGDTQARIISLRENLLQAKLSGAERTWAMGELRDLLAEVRGGVQKVGRPKQDKPKKETKAKKKKSTKIPRPKPVTQTEIAGEFNVSRDTARRDLKRYDNLTKRAAAAYQAGAITTKQADLLADMPSSEQAKELTKMREENYLETKKRLEEEEKKARFEKAKKDAPVAARKMLRALNKKIKEEINPDFGEFLQFVGQYKIDRSVLGETQVPHIEQLAEYIDGLWGVLS
jgi:ParB-like chromosome segregation protein Spo0J